MIKTNYEQLFYSMRFQIDSLQEQVDINMGLEEVMELYKIMDGFESQLIPPADVTNRTLIADLVTKFRHHLTQLDEIVDFGSGSEEISVLRTQLPSIDKFLIKRELSKKSP